ncbi:MAG: cupredoxin domain-containing protein [Alphaproteobacteria bacterium]|jgi:uncharacterized cupredoxin-like copper-binding protein
MKKNIASAIIASAVLVAGSAAWASPGHGISKNAVGQLAKASDASRTIEVLMHDNYYTPENITIKKGETIRFVIKNMGGLVHEFNIGTSAMHAGHQKEMEMMVQHGILEADKINYKMMKMDMGGGKTMEHNDPNSVLLEPGKSKEVVWKFSDSKNLEFSCNVPGHNGAGMVGKFNLK